MESCTGLESSQLWIKRLIQIDPQNTGEKCDGGREGQEQNNCPDHIFGDPPSRRRPQQARDQRDDQQRDAVTDIHRADEVACLPGKLQIANRAALLHFGKAAKDRAAKNSSQSATGTALAENTAQD